MATFIGLIVEPKKAEVKEAPKAEPIEKVEEVKAEPKPKATKKK